MSTSNRNQSFNFVEVALVLALQVEAVRWYTVETVLNGQTFHRLSYPSSRGRMARIRERPLLNSQANLLIFDQEKLTRIAQNAKKLIVRLFVLDGWFGKRTPVGSAWGGLPIASDFRHHQGFIRKFMIWA